MITATILFELPHARINCKLPIAAAYLLRSLRFGLLPSTPTPLGHPRAGTVRPGRRIWHFCTGRRSALSTLLTFSGGTFTRRCEVHCGCLQGGLTPQNTSLVVSWDSLCRLSHRYFPWVAKTRKYRSRRTWQGW